MIESLHTTRTKVDALREEREEFERMLEEAQPWTTIEALQDALHQKDDELEELHGQAQRAKADLI